MYEPCMNSLWYGLYNMVPFLRCFPEEVWEVEDPREYGRKFELRRPLLPSDWARFLHHAGRVRSLGPTDDHDHLKIMTHIEQHIAPESAYHALDMSKPREILLPNLRTLHWKFTQDELQHIRPFLCPSMRDISIVLYAPPSMAERSLLLSLSSMMKQVTSFCIDIDYTALDGSDDYAIYVNPILKDIISFWDRLRTLVIPSTSLTASSLPHIALLPYLEELTVELREEIGLSCLEGHAFPALWHLAVYCNSLSMCTKFLQLSQSWTLENVDVTISRNHLDSAETTQAFFKVLQSHVSNENLSGVSVSSLDLPNASNNHILDIETLAPLLSLPHLGWLNISTPHPFNLCDRDLWKIATAWPELQTLTLGRHGWGVPSLITPNGLASLLNQCRQLSSLSLAIDASAFDWYQLNDATFVMPHMNLCFLDLQDSRLHDARTMAVFLADVVPEISVIAAWSQHVRGRHHVSHFEADALARKWDRARSAANARAMLRRQEKYRQRRLMQLSIDSSTSG
ncbi:hypothetical protein FIBSPDRAFT_930633 [Athelia psychrophila]|uniref:F-box domain-containing protein n=1 Tax=Athelia psychrophila TaxID=1759441 RepID=A0A166LU06_9AGAM|nr:hypothetical protein FIBSPDRAFT_930633 [Fibularhizoctonia sp. CBS 109695]